MDSFEVERQFVTVRELLVGMREAIDAFGYEEIVPKMDKIEKDVRAVEAEVREMFEP